MSNLPRPIRATGRQGASILLRIGRKPVEFGDHLTPY